MPRRLTSTGTRNGGQLLLPVLDGTLDDAVDNSTVEDGDDGPTIVLAGGFRLPLRGLDPSAPIPKRAELAGLLSRQAYRLVDWRTRDRNHRRFFEIDTLAGVSVEDPLVRRRRHALLVRLLDRYPELLAGVRVDHVDGLADPDEYLTWLRELIGPQRLLLVEKIVIDDESLPRRWPVDGTTGYEFSRLVDQLLLDPDGAAALHQVWMTATGSGETYASVEHRSIEEVLRDRLRPEVDRIHRLVDDVEPLQGQDGVETIIALATAMDRYRTYLPHGGRNDIELLEAAGSRASDRSGGRYPVARLVAMLTTPDSERHEQAQTLFQQLTGPALAKGAEDRALYRHHPIAALNEVGGDPDADAAPASEFHAWAERSAQRSPRQLLTTSTHDTKRSGDLRARVLALTHHASAWRSFHQRWAASSTLHPADLHLLLQTVVGAWPIDRKRLSDYLVKALREGAERSSWIEPDHAYEQAVSDEGVRLLGDTRFVEDLEQLVAVIEPRAVTNSLIQTTLRLTAPGFGDLYRGSEVFDRSLVDPDNRRPVDWERLAAALDTATHLDVPSALDHSPDMAKLALIVRLLEARRTHTDACLYARLEVRTADPERVIAFRARSLGRHCGNRARRPGRGRATARRALAVGALRPSTAAHRASTRRSGPQSALRLPATV